VELSAHGKVKAVHAAEDLQLDDVPGFDVAEQLEFEVAWGHFQHAPADGRRTGSPQRGLDAVEGYDGRAERCSGEIGARAEIEHNRAACTQPTDTDNRGEPCRETLPHRQAYRAVARGVAQQPGRNRTIRNVAAPVGLSVPVATLVRGESGFA